VVARTEVNTAVTIPASKTKATKSKAKKLSTLNVLTKHKKRSGKTKAKVKANKEKAKKKGKKKKVKKAKKKEKKEKKKEKKKAKKKKEKKKGKKIKKKPKAKKKNKKTKANGNKEEKLDTEHVITSTKITKKPKINSVELGGNRDEHDRLRQNTSSFGDQTVADNVDSKANKWVKKVFVKRKKGNSSKMRKKTSSEASKRHPRTDRLRQNANADFGQQSIVITDNAASTKTAYKVVHVRKREKKGRRRGGRVGRLRYHSAFAAKAKKSKSKT